MQCAYKDKKKFGRKVSRMAQNKNCFYTLKGKDYVLLMWEYKV